METTAVNCHANDKEVNSWQFKAGSDAKQVAWLEIASTLKLYASHIELLEIITKNHGAHW